MNHDYTPEFYGGMVCNYAISPKLNFNGSIYYLGEQTINYTYRNLDEMIIDEKTTCNFKLTYKPGKRSAIYLNIRNAFNKTAREFAYADNVNRLFMTGFSYSF